MSCPQCGSTNLRLITAEFAFIRGAESFVYSVHSPTVCLDCGMSRGCLPSDTIDNLRSGFDSSLTDEKRLVPRSACLNCNSSRLALFDRVEIAFGLGKGPPVHLRRTCTVKVCLGCGLSEFAVRKEKLETIRVGIRTELRPPISIMAKRARGTA